MSIKDATIDWLHDSAIFGVVVTLTHIFVLDGPPNWTNTAVFVSVFLALSFILRVANRKRHRPRPQKWYYRYLPQSLFQKKSQ